MARNEEKQLGRLNRLLLEKQREEFEKTHPKRPKLDSLETAEEIRQWIPSIKQDIEFYLKKSQVVCYSDEHVSDAMLKVSKLEKEFKAFLRKLRNLSPGLSEVPWTQRIYKSKKEGVVHKKHGPYPAFSPIPTPLLDLEENRAITEEEPDVLPAVITYPPSNDLPLQFNLPLSSENGEKSSDVQPQITCFTTSLPSSSSNLCDRTSSKSIIENLECKVSTNSANSDTEVGTLYNNICITESKYSVNKTSSKNILGIDYSSSSEDET